MLCFEAILKSYSYNREDVAIIIVKIIILAAFEYIYSRSNKRKNLFQNETSLTRLCRADVF